MPNGGPGLAPTVLEEFSPDFPAVDVDEAAPTTTTGVSPAAGEPELNTYGFPDVPKLNLGVSPVVCC